MRPNLSAACVRPLAASVLALALLAPAPAALAQVQVNSSWSVTRSENGRSVTLSSANGQLSASVDGTPVPADRIKTDNGLITILDEQGNVLLAQPAPMTGGLRPGAQDLRNPRLWNEPAGRAGVAQPPADAPKVMVGVQLMEPDAILRGHFGLKEGDATLVAAVAQGLPAAAAGLKPYDLIVSVDGKQPASSNTVRDAFRSRQPGQTITLEVLQKGERKTITITPEAFDAARMDAAPMDAIASAGDWQGLSRPGRAGVGMFGGNQPFVLTLPGPGGQMLIGPEHAAVQERVEEFFRDFGEPIPGGPGAAGVPGVDINRLMNERMKRIEEMMQRLMERQPPVPPAPGTQPAPRKDDKTSFAPGFRVRANQIS